MMDQERTPPSPRFSIGKNRGSGGIIFEQPDRESKSDILVDDDYEKSIAKAADCGTGEGGFKPGNVCATGKGSEGGAATDKVTRTDPPKVSPKTKSEIAKASARRVGATIQAYAKAHNEPQIAKAIGGKSWDNNEPIDVEITIDGKLHGIELKTLVDNKHNKLTMKRSAISNKRRWERNNKGRVHTVVLNDENVFEGATQTERDANMKSFIQTGSPKPDLSKRKFYYRRGYGSFRVSTMHEASGIEEIKELLSKRRNQLPPGAGGKKRKQKKKTVMGMSGLSGGGGGFLIVGDKEKMPGMNRLRQLYARIKPDEPLPPLSANYEARQKKEQNCGTGGGGFQPDNVCAEDHGSPGEGEHDWSGGKKKEKKLSSAQEEVMERLEERGWLQEELESRLPDNWKELDEDALEEAGWKAQDDLRNEMIEDFVNERGVSEGELYDSLPDDEVMMMGSKDEVNDWLFESHSELEKINKEFEIRQVSRNMIRSAASSLESIAEKEGWDVVDVYKSRSSLSTYVTLEIDNENYEVRFSDHDQVAGGGWNPGTGTRNGESDFSFNVMSGGVDLSRLRRKIKFDTTALQKSYLEDRDRFSNSAKRRYNVYLII